MIREELIANHKLMNLLHTVVLFLAMLALLALLGFFLGGITGLFWAALVSIPFLIMGQRVSPQLALRMYGAIPLRPADAPRLHEIVWELARRAGLPNPPDLHYIPSQMMNAFSVGSPREAAVAVTDALLRGLSTREVIAVLAHEMAHIQENDARVTAFADLIGRMTGVLATIGQVLLVLNLPLALAGRAPIPWLAILLLIIAPYLSNQLRLALSRAREVDADLGGVRLTGDPSGLASALQKMRHPETSLLRRLLLPGGQVPDPSVLRTHPRTDARIQRLLGLLDERQEAIMPDTREVSSLPDHLTRQVKSPRWHMTGFW